MKELMPAIAGAAACAAVFFLPVVFLNKSFIARDHYLFYHPRSYFVAQTVREGSLPLWNPYCACGAPAQANVQSAVFYPFSLLVYLLPFTTGYNVYSVLHYILAAGFMFALMRSWSASAVAAGLAGMVYAFGGYCASINDNTAFLASAAWTPLVLLCCDRLLQKRSFGVAVAAAVVIALQILAGDASFYLLSSFLITFLYALRHIARGRQPHPNVAVKTLSLLIAVWLGGVLLAAVQLVPFFEYALQSHRAGGLGFAQASKWSLHPVELLQLIMPYPFGSIVPGTRWFGQQWLDTIYIGVFPLLCALLFLRARGGARKGFLCILLAAGVLLGIGRYNPCYFYLFRFVPGFAMLQYPVKFFFLAHFALSVMAGLGFEALRDMLARPAPTRRIIITVTGCAGVAFICVLLLRLSSDTGYRSFLNLYPHNDYLMPLARLAWNDLGRALLSLTGFLLLFCLLAAAASRRLIGGWAMTAIFLCVVFVDLLALGKPADPYLPQAAISRQTETGALIKQDPSLFRIYSIGPSQTQRSFLHVYSMPFDRVYRMIRETLQANTNIYEGIHSAEEYSDLLLTRYYDVFAAAEQCIRDKHPDPGAVASCVAMLSLLNVKYIVSPFALEAFPFKRVHAGPVNIYENPMVMPRAFAAPRIEVLQSDSDVLDRMRRSDYRPSAQVYTTAKEWDKVRSGCSTIVGDGSPAVSVRIRDYHPNTVTISAIAEKPALLVLADTYYPGWKAFDNGREIPVLRVNHTLRGLMLEPGSHEIVFVFNPASLQLGACVTFAATVLVLLGVLVCKLRRPQREAIEHDH